MSGILAKIDRIIRGGRLGFQSIIGSFAAGAFAVGLMTACTAAAQTASTFDTGTITGTVTDQSGAVIPHASVTITNTGTGSVTTAETNSAGIFSAPGLSFGDYTVSASASQFGKTSTRPFALNVGARVAQARKTVVAANHFA